MTVFVPTQRYSIFDFNNDHFSDGKHSEFTTFGRK